MDGRRHLYALIGGAVLSLAAPSPLYAQEGPRTGGTVPGQLGPNRSRTIERWRGMSPEDRRRFQTNAERWRQMPAEERQELRVREGLRQERLRREAEEALRTSGLELEAERRRQYELRYIEERRRVERALRQELAEKRQRELAPVVERLKKEFNQPRSPVTTGVPGSPSSKK